MDYQTIRVTETDGYGVIALNRPEVKNAFNTQMRAEILHATKALSLSMRALVITGTGDAFCSGQDLGDRATVANTDLERTLRDEYMPMIRAIVDAPIPVLAAVNGAAAGAGTALALAADVVIATESAIFLQAFARIGLIPDAGVTHFLPQQVGMARAMGAALFAEPVTAKQAQDWGMIWEAVPDKSFEARWKDRAAKLASGPTTSYIGIKEALRASAGNSLEDQLLLEAKLQGRCGKTRDFREGVLAFLEKRPAQYEGR